MTFTAGVVQLRDVIVRLPASWAVCAPATTLPAARSSRPADLVIAEETLLADRPYTAQYDGCGVPGLSIQLPLALATGNATEAEAARLLKEWTKLRFGVFEEVGFHADSLYPRVFQEGKQNLTNAGCNTTVQVRSRSCFYERKSPLLLWMYIYVQLVLIENS